MENIKPNQLMMAATEDNIPMLLKILAMDRSQLFMKDKNGRTALDLARMARNFYAISIILMAMETDFNDARLSTIGSEVDVEKVYK